MLKVEEETRLQEALMGAEESANAAMIPEITPTKLRGESVWRGFASRIPRPATWRKQSAGSMDIRSPNGRPAQSECDHDTTQFLPETSFPVVSQLRLSTIPAQTTPT